jgi:hypothetical protein
MAQNNERVILIRALIGLFTFQLAIAGYQSLTCDKSKSSEVEFCTQSNENLIETSKSVANVFLALLVPAAAVSAARGSNSSRSQKSKDEPEV